MILPSLYHAPIVYYALLLSDPGDSIVEQHDHYTKQTYRNRCRILGGNGAMNLIVPVVKEHGKKTKIKDIRIDNDMPWKDVHWKSIHAAYASSPFFEFIIDAFQEFYQRSYVYLIDLNMDLLQTTLELLDSETQLARSEEFIQLDPYDDSREQIHPKRPFMMRSVDYRPEVYHQVFNERYGFVEDLSILDLLFNEGQNAAALLKKSITHL